MEQGRPLLRASCTAKQVHSHHDRHGVEPEKQSDAIYLFNTYFRGKSRSIKGILNSHHSSEVSWNNLKEPFKRRRRNVLFKVL